MQRMVVKKDTFYALSIEEKIFSLFKVHYVWCASVVVCGDYLNVKMKKIKIYTYTPFTYWGDRERKRSILKIII